MHAVPPRLLLAGDSEPPAPAVVKAAGFTLVGDRPDIVLCHGGDGTLLRAERDWPGVTKVPARVGARARLCDEHRLPAILERLREGRLQRESLGKLDLTVAGRRFLAVNDVVMRNESPATAVRFRLACAEAAAPAAHAPAGPLGVEITGDGLVFTTPFGSTGYYRSITREVITEGVGVAFNNSTEAWPPLHFTAGAAIDVIVLRGPAVLVHDNDARAIPLREGHRFTVRGLPETGPDGAVVLGLDALRCQRCCKADGSGFNPH